MGDRAWDIITIRNAMEQGLKPQFQRFQNTFINPLRQRLEGIATDPLGNFLSIDRSKLGFDEATKGKMFGRAADALAGSKESMMKNLRKTTAASGLGNTGQMIRSMKEYGKGHEANLRGAARDVELASEEAKRQDVRDVLENQWRGISGMMDTGQMEMGSRAQEQNFWNSMFNASQAYSGLAQSEGGFWDSFKNSLGSTLGRSVGSGFGAWSGGQ